MKYLELNSIEMLNNQLEIYSSQYSGVYKLQCHLEAYSCKDTVEDKKLRRSVESKYPINSNMEVTEGSILSRTDEHQYRFEQKSKDVERTARKGLFYLLATLNALYPDYDYSYLFPQAFTLLPNFEDATKLIDSALSQYQMEPKLAVQLSENILACIDEVIDIKNCFIYRFQPESSSEPNVDNCYVSWSCYLFFFNKKLKRIVYFMSRYMCPISDSETDIWDHSYY